MTAGVFSLLLAAGICDHEPCSSVEIEEKASWISEACESDAAGPPVGEECARILIALWSVESGGRFLAWPSGRWTGSGEGPLQLARPATCWSNARIGVWCPSWHEALGGEPSIRLAVAYLRVKWRGRAKATVEAWNGGASPGYGERVRRVLAKFP